MWREQQGGGLTLGIAPRLAGPAAVDGVQTSLTKPAGTRAMAEQFALYHHLPPAKNRPPLPSSAADFAKVLDFHKALTALSSYPSLPRPLRLVFDVEVPASLCPVSPASPRGAYATLAGAAVNARFKLARPPRFSFPAS